METTETHAPEVEGLAIVLPPHLTENFETAVNQIRERYGLSPDVPALIRLWTACATSSRIRREFEHAVLEIKRRPINPHTEGLLDDDDL